MRKLKVSCPTCKKKFEYASSKFRPFCTERCRLVDLGQWLDESYSVWAPPTSEAELQEIEQLTYASNLKQKDRFDEED